MSRRRPKAKASVLLSPAAATARRGSDGSAAARVLSASVWFFLVGAAFSPCFAESGATQSTALTASPLSVTSLVQVTLGLGAVLVLILLLAWLVRRFGPLSAGGAGVVRLLGGVSLGQREKAVLVQVGDKQLLLGVAPGSVRTLHVFSEPIRLESSKSGEGPRSVSRPAGAGFAERLQAALSERIKQ